MRYGRKGKGRLRRWKERVGEREKVWKKRKGKVETMEGEGRREREGMGEKRREGRDDGRRG